MNWIDKVSKYQNVILNNGILVEYELFFSEVAKNHCKFAIDEYEELEELNNVILMLRKKDKNAEIYVNTYGIDSAEKNQLFMQIQYGLIL